MGRRNHTEDWGRHGAHCLPNATQMQHETGKPLHIKGLLRIFDSAIPRFESWRPSHPVRSLRCDFQVWENRRHSLAFPKPDIAAAVDQIEKSRRDLLAPLTHAAPARRR